MWFVLRIEPLDRITQGKIMSITKYKSTHSSILQESRSLEYVHGSRTSVACRRNWFLGQESKANLQVLESSFSSENVPCLGNPAYVRESSTVQQESEYEKAILERQIKNRRRKPHVGKNDCFNELLHSWERTSSRALWEAQESNSSQSLHRSRVMSTMNSTADCSSPQELSNNLVESCVRNPTCPAENLTTVGPCGVRALIQIYENIAGTSNKCNNE